MTKYLRRWAGLMVGAALAIGFSSCAYDPYYSSTSVGGSYSTGYGDGYGYGGDSFSTSFFVSTGDPRWGYDPYSYSYYDYHRHAYYDPYLYGYYPVGYRPPIVYGAPHPYGWTRGRGSIRPPARIYDRRVHNYRDRVSAYRNSNFDWARQVRQRPAEPRVIDSRPATTRYERQLQNRRESTIRPSSRPSTRQNVAPSRPATRGSRPSSRYSTPVVLRDTRNLDVPERRARQQQAPRQLNRQSRPAVRESRAAVRESRPAARPSREERREERRSGR